MERTIVKIGHGELEQLIYRDKPVVTFAQIAQVHGTSVDTVDKSFRRHRERFVEGEDYFRLDFTEASQLPLKVRVSPNGLIVFTEAGYLLLVKPMHDKVAWEVQRQMRAAYFVLRQSSDGQSSAMDRADMLVEMAISLRAQERKLEAIKEAQERDRFAIIASQKDIIAVQKEQITIQQEQLAIQKDALEAKEAAIVAIQSMQWVTIRQYVEIHGLHHQMPQSVQQRFATWLTNYCMEHNSAMYKATTADRQWPNEKTYCIAVIKANLTAWLKRYGFAIDATLLLDPDHDTPPETDN
jgi:ORF6N domain